MCGRYTLVTPLDVLQQRFGFAITGIDLKPRYNIAPTQEVLTVTQDGARNAHLMRWGLILFWAKDRSIGYKAINAMAETAATKPMFREAFKRRRCLVIADGFYEWKKDGAARTPYRIVLKSREPFAFAGLWESWTDKSTGETTLSCTILTVPPNSLAETSHNRMPAILSEETEPLWLDPKTQDSKALTAILGPYPAEEMEAYRVSAP